MPDSPRLRRFRASALLIALVPPVLGAGCGGASGPVPLTVLADSSLTEVLGELRTAYRHEQPRVRLRLSFGAAPELADRVTGHDPGDVLVTADAESMDELTRRLDARRRTVAHGSLTIAVAPGNPRRIRTLADLQRPRLRVVVGAGTVPVGRHTRRMLAKAGVTVRWNSEEISARAVLDRVRSGEADAGVVYLTDLPSAGVAVSSVPVPASLNVTAAFTAATVRDRDHEPAADAFTAWLLTPDAQQIFHKHGFAAPPPPAEARR